MKETIISLRSAFRAFNDALRKNYNDAIITGQNVRRMSGNQITRDEAKQAQKKLLMLVPFERAFTVLSQVDNPSWKSIAVYVRLYEALLKRIRDSHGFSYDREDLLSGGVDGLQILIPVENTPFSKWNTQTISEVAASVDAQISIEKKERVKKGRSADRALQKFLSSLTLDQINLLDSAIESAKLDGRHAVSLSERDLASLRK